MTGNTSGGLDDSQGTASESETGEYFQSDKYTVGWICSLKCELKAARTMLDEEHPALRVQAEQDGNNYLLGRIGQHNVAITSLPQAGTNRAATAAKSMQTTFPNVRFCLMVGVGGGVPSKDSSWNDVRLGDIVVSEPTEQGGGVIQYDMGRREVDGFRRLGTLNKPPGLLLAAMKSLHTTKNLGRAISDLVNDKFGDEEDPDEEWIYPKRARDVLFDTDHYQTTKSIDILAACGVALFFPATYWAVWPQDQDRQQLGLSLVIWTCCLMSCLWIVTIWYLRSSPVRRKPRQTNQPKIHYGNIGSGNSVVKNAVERDELAKRDNVICFEMEAAGIMDDFPCLVIRGISDYADSYKRWDWQPYAAAVAAAYGKKLLLTISPIGVKEMRAMRKITQGVERIQKQTKKLVRNQKLREEENYLAWLTPIDHSSKHREILRQRQAETGQWVLESEKFQKWLSATHPGTLLCPGMPGAGKTFIAATIIDHLQQRFRDNPEMAVIYIYFDFNWQHEQTADNLIASLVKQLARLRPDTLSRLYQGHQRNQTEPSWEDMLKTLQGVAASYTRIFLVFDALDECQNNGTRKLFLQAIFDLQIQTSTSILGTSRYNAEIQQMFQNSDVLEIHATNQDIERYIDGNMHKLPDFVENSRELSSKIKEQIVARVNGMFLLATLYINFLIGQVSENDLMEVLSILPTGGQAYDEAYERCMERIERQIGNRKTLARKLLAWVTCAVRPLKESELEHALAVKVGKSSLDKGDIPHEMVEVCAGLVRIDPESREIRLVHFTTKEYFQRTLARWFPEAQYDITMTCITYIGFETFQTGICETGQEMEARFRLNPLYHYAAQYWGQHARDATQIQQEVTLKFLRDLAKTEACAQAMNGNQYSWIISSREARGMTGLHIVAYFGLNDILELLLQVGCGINVRNSLGITPLSIAAKLGWPDTVRRLLMEKDVEINASDDVGRTPLTVAANQGHHTVVRELLKHPSIDINVQTKYVRPTALSFAAVKGHVKVVKRLLEESNIDINSEDENGRTALGLAATAGKEEVVELLLTVVDIDIDHVDWKGRTALMLASMKGHALIMKRLLEHGAARERQDTNGRTALHFAVDKGCLEGVKLLGNGKYRVNLEIQDKLGFTALHLASQAIFWSEGRREEMVAILLANGADARAKTLSGMTVEDLEMTDSHDLLTRLQRLVEVDSKCVLDPAKLRKLVSRITGLQKETWNLLTETASPDLTTTIHEINTIMTLNSRSTGLRFEETHDVSIIRQLEFVYQVLSQCLRTYFKHLTGISVTHTGKDLVRFYVKKWNAFSYSSRAIRLGYRHLNRYWIRECKHVKKHLAEPYRLCLQHWKDDFFLVIREHLVEACRLMRQDGKRFDFADKEHADKRILQDFQDMLPSHLYKL